jgi:phytoene desaturase
MSGKRHAIVIGSGFGGLAAAARLGAKGYRVTVLEKLDAPGGRAYVFRQDGFTFDGGPTIVTAPYLFEDLWARCGRKLSDDVTLLSLDPFYKVRFDDGDVFDYTADLERMRAQVARIEPRDVEGFDRFLAESERIHEVAFAQLGAQPFHELGTLLRAVPDLLRLGGYRTVYQNVCRHFLSPKLRLLFSFHPLLIGGNPFSTTAYYCLIAHLERTFGVHYVMGGTGALVQGIVGLVEGQGGTIRCNAEVAAITTEGRRALQRRRRLDLRSPTRRAAAEALDRPAARPRTLFDEPVRLVLRHQPALRFGLPPHDGAWSAIPRAAR